MMTFPQMLALKAEDLENEIRKSQKEFLEVLMRIRLREEKNTAKKPKLRKYIAQLNTARTQLALAQ